MKKRKRYVYFIQAGKDGPVKIGVTNTVSQRMTMMQAHNHEELYLLLSFEGNELAELSLHRMFAEYHIRGEWFRYGPEIQKFVERRAPKYPNVAMRINASRSGLYSQFPGWNG